MGGLESRAQLGWREDVRPLQQNHQPEKARPKKVGVKKHRPIIGIFSSVCVLALLAASPALAQDHGAGAGTGAGTPGAPAPSGAQGAPGGQDLSKGGLPSDAEAMAMYRAPPPCSVASAAALDQTPLRVKGWAITFPMFADSITRDEGCWRTKLAKYGVGLMVLGGPSVQANILDHPRPAQRQDTYFGQKLGSWSSTFSAYMTFDLSRYGVPDGQFVLAGSKLNSSNINYLADKTTLTRLAYYQTMFDKQLELNVGYIGNYTDFIGAFVGGNLNNPFGVAAGIPVIAGMSIPADPAPTFKLKWNVTDRFYNHFAIQRSTIPAQNTVLAERYGNPKGFKFFEDDVDVRGNRFSSSYLLINEIGYKNEAGPNTPYTWLRAGAMYNNSRFYDYRDQGVAFLANPFTPGTKKGTQAYYVLADRQLWQADPQSPFTGFRGLYAGGSAMFAPARTSAVSQYYEGRLYGIGLFDSRPFDMISLVYFHQKTSPYFNDGINNLPAVALNPSAPFGVSACQAGILCSPEAANSYTATYTARLYPGVYLTAGLNYVDRPAFLYTPKTSTPGVTWVEDSLALVGNLTLFF